MTNRSLCKRFAAQPSGFTTLATVSSIFNRKFRTWPHTPDHTRRPVSRTGEKLHFYMRNHRRPPRNHDEEEKKKREKRKRAKRLVEETASVVGGQGRTRFRFFFTITNKTGARVRSLARITSYTFAISGFSAANTGGSLFETAGVIMNPRESLEHTDSDV